MQSTKMKSTIKRIILLATIFTFNLAIVKAQYSDFTCICGKNVKSNEDYYYFNESRTNKKEIYIAGPSRGISSTFSNRMFCSEICAMNYYKTFYSRKYSLAEKPSDFEELLGTMYDFFKLIGPPSEPQSVQQKPETTEVQQNNNRQPASNSVTTIVKTEPHSVIAQNQNSGTIISESIKTGPHSVHTRVITSGNTTHTIISGSIKSGAEVANNTENNTPLVIIPEKTEAPISTSSTDNSFGVGGTIQRPDNKIDPLSENDGSHSFSIVGFNNWYVSIYGQNPPVQPILDQKTKSATLTVGERKLKFIYNQVLADWNLPSNH